MKEKIFTLSAICTFTFLFFQTSYATGAGQPVMVKFGLLGNSVVVNASVNGAYGHFIIDTGSPGLILNKAYFEGIAHPTEQTDILDFQGKPSPATYLAVKDFAIGEMDMPEELGYVTDIRAFEKIKGAAIHGIIGYSTLKNFELLFDFENKRLTFFPLGKKGQPVGRTMTELPTTVFDLKLSGHIPYLITSFGGKKVRMGIDSGSEVNVMHDRFFEKSEMEIHDEREIKVRGLAGDMAIARAGSMYGLGVGNHIENNVDITVTDLSPLNQTLPIRIHGLIGIAYLKQTRFSINYKKKELCIWSRQKDEPILKPAEELELEAEVAGQGN